MINHGVDDRLHERALFFESSPFRRSIWEASQDHQKLDCGCEYDTEKDELFFCSEVHQAQR